jgi:hypothetical protein
MASIQGTRIRILLALGIVLPALLALLAWQFGRDDAILGDNVGNQRRAGNRRKVVKFDSRQECTFADARSRQNAAAAAYEVAEHWHDALRPRSRCIQSRQVGGAADNIG